MLSEEMKGAIQNCRGILVHSKEEGQEIVALLENSGFYHNQHYSAYDFINNFDWDKPRRIYVIGMQIEHSFANDCHKLIAYDEIMQEHYPALETVYFDEIL